MVKQPASKPSEFVKLRGTVTTGIGESRSFTAIPWVKKQFINKLGIDPYPGTFNLNVSDSDSEKLDALRNASGIEIVPQDTNFCTARSFLVLVGNRIKGAAVIPLVADYPRTKLEIIAAENIRQSLSLDDGDVVEVTVYL